MSAENLLQAGELEAALDALQGQVKASPADSKLRIFLFQLLAMTGQWKRAETQLELSGELDAEALAMVAVYKDVINCELHREAVFSGKSRPLVLGEPEEWVALLVEAQQAFAQGDFDKFAKFNAEAFEKADTSTGKINGEPFEWIADADQRFGPLLEAIFNGHYYWVPMSRIRRLTTEEPSDLRDLVWLPAEVTWINGGQNVVMMPSRYPAIQGASNSELLSRRTDWQARSGEIYEGVGQKMFTTDKQDYPFLQIRSIEFDE